MKKLLTCFLAVLLVACSSTTVKDVDPQEAVDAAIGTILETNQIMMMDMDASTIAFYFGIDESLIETAFGKGPMMTAHIDMVCAIRAKDGQLEAVESAVKAYQENLAADTMQYPSNLAAIQNAKIFTKGNTVYYIRLNSFDSTATEDQLAEQIESINNAAQDAIKALH